VRAGVVTTPTLFAGGRTLAGSIDARALDQLSAGAG
jgi:protein-disulfide isomerase